MTCYETLSVPPTPACPADAPMAHHLVKWWRNKFRSGYKKFHLVTEGERTDTEELVGRGGGGAGSQCSAPPDLLPSEARALLHASPSPPPSPTPAPAPAPPPRLPASPPPPAPQHHKPPRLRFEELTCDVSVQEAAAHQPLQFSFTLYDLDGHGRMTKDDIAGIVSTIYESIGKSVTVPHYGSKTIQVRLTVVPEGGPLAPPAAPAAAAPPAPDRPAAARREGRRRARRRKDTKPDCGDATDDERRSRLSLDEESSCSGERRRGVRGRSTAAHPAHPAPPPPRPRDKERERRPSKKRSSSLQRRELLQIIQANMEKNRLSFQNSRKPHERMIPEEETPSPKQHRHRSRAFTLSAQPAASPPRASRTTPAAAYLDLAPAPAPAAPGADTNLCRYDRYLHAVICSSAKHAHSGYHRRDLPTTPPIPAAAKPHKTPRAHHRSRSHDVPPPAPRIPAAPAPPPPAPAAPVAASEPRVLQIIFL